MNRKLTIGQRLFSLNIGNNARYRKQVLTPVVVFKVGRKYFSVKTEGPYQIETEYRIEDWRENHECLQNSKLYESEQEWLDEKEIETICHEIWKAFDCGKNRHNLSIETLRRIDNEIHKTRPPATPAAAAS